MSTVASSPSRSARPASSQVLERALDPPSPPTTSRPLPLPPSPLLQPPLPDHAGAAPRSPPRSPLTTHSMSPPSVSPPSSLSESPSSSAAPHPPPLSPPTPLPPPRSSINTNNNNNNNTSHRQKSYQHQHHHQHHHHHHHNSPPPLHQQPQPQQTLVSPSLSASPTVGPLRLDSSDDVAASVARPSLYHHAPVARAAPFERYYGYVPTAHLELLDELKSDRLEGIYNLSFLLLAFSLIYLFIRNVVETGLHLVPSHPCLVRMARDFVRLLALVASLPFILVPPFALIAAHARAFISTRLVLRFYVAFLAVTVVVATNAIFNLALNPLCALGAALVLVIFALKTHSYVLTNILLAEETAALRRERRRARLRARRACTPIDGPAPPLHPQSDLPDSSSSSSETITSGSSASTSESSSSRDAPSLEDTGLRQRRADPNERNTAGLTLGVENNNNKNNGSNNNNNPTTSSSNLRRGISAISGGDRPASVVYPRNITLRNLMYFAMAPTLVYETSYPRTQSIRSGYVLSYALQALVCGVFQYVLLVQFCVPVWTATTSGDMWFLTLKLAIPSFLMWLTMFWGFFHCTLNAIAEVTRFADRQFYREWWNATTLHQFWRWWNIPVYEWCVRHLYVESVERHQVNHRAAAFGTFVMSAFVHEFVCFATFRLVRPYMFGCMLAQVPLMELSTRLSGSRTGNMLMWAMLFLGQSCMVLFYLRDYIIAYGTLCNYDVAT